MLTLTLLKPNLSEAYAAAKMPPSTSLDQVAAQLLQVSAAELLLITRSEAGISLFHASGERTDFPVRSKEVKDVTGAGDVFIAAFAFAREQAKLTEADCLRFANEIAGESCRHRGTWVCPKAFAQGVLDKIRVSKEFAQQVPDQTDYSMQAVPQPYFDCLATVAKEIERASGIPLEDFFRDVAEQGVALRTLDSLRSPRQSPSAPTDTSDTQPLADRVEVRTVDESQTECTTPNPNGSAHPHGRKPQRDQ